MYRVVIVRIKKVRDVKLFLKCIQMLTAKYIIYGFLLLKYGLRDTILRNKPFQKSEFE